MKRDLRYNLMACLLLAGFLFSACASKKGPASTQISKEEVLKQMQLANTYFMQKWPDTGKPIYTTRWRPSNIWTRAVYYEGLMDLYKIDPNKKYYDYAVAWGENHDWNLRNGIETRNADDQACGQIYLDLYEIDPQPERLAAIKANIDGIIESKLVNDWTWIDAIQMAMPVFAKLGVMYKDESYFNAMHQFYLHSRNVEGGGLYNAEDDLWWRDKDFVPPYKEPNGEDCYWSRGNGWVVAAYVRVLDLLPKDHAYATVYSTDFKNMMKALLACQRPDGFWNVSLHDPNHFGGAETSGTALFVYGMAWGIQHGLLDEATYREPMERAWQAIAQHAIHPSGFLGYVQGTGKEPKDGQPVSFSSIPDFEDYGLGCFLLAGTAYYNYLASK